MGLHVGQSLSCENHVLEGNLLKSDSEQGEEGPSLARRRFFKCIENSVVCFSVNFEEFLITLG